MKSTISFLLGSFSGLLYFNEIYSSLSIGIFVLLLYVIFFKSNQQFVFREWALILYALNYLVAPAITYIQPEEVILYGMKIPRDEYFILAIPGFISLTVGMYILPSKIFTISTKEVDSGALLNKKFLINITIFSLLIRLVYSSVPGELSFVFYLISLLRFVSSFALLSIDRRLWYWPTLVLSLDCSYKNSGYE